LNRFPLLRLVPGLLITCAAPVALAQQGPLTPPPRAEIKRLPAEVKTDKAPIPPEEIIRKFTTREDEAQRKFDAANYKFTLKVVEYDSSGAAVGEAQLVSQVYYKEDGNRFARIVEQPDERLKRGAFSLVDLQDLAAIAHFPLTSGTLEKYDVTYIGTDQVDEIPAFLLAVKPRRVDRTHRYFDGLVWVDDRDFDVVKTYGKFVSEVSREELFPMLETYREVVDGARLPTYVRSEGYLKSKAGESKLRLTLRYGEFAPSPHAPPAKPAPAPAAPAAKKTPPR
jgi:hypothetical protein